jgi:RNA-directed DNA polymerase
MRRYKNLFEEVASFRNLLSAAKRAYRGKRDRQSVAAFYFNLEHEVIGLREELLAGSYRPRPYNIFEIREPKIRKICSSHFRDRVVHHAICDVLEPIFDRRLIFDTYACRTGKGSHRAMDRCQRFARRYDYFLKCDIRKYFDSIDHAALKALLRRIVGDFPLLDLIERVIDHSVPGSPPGKGVPIGNLTSQHFANLYLGELDHFLKERRRLKGYLRYMDDFICFSNDKAELQMLLGEIREYAKKTLHLELKEEVTRIAPVSEGIPFLGFRIFRNLKRLQRPNLMRLRKNIRRKEVAYRSGKINETDLFMSVQSMIAHISHADTLALKRREFERSLHLA